MMRTFLVVVVKNVFFHSQRRGNYTFDFMATFTLHLI